MNRREQQTEVVKAGANTVLTEVAALVGLGMQRLLAKERRRRDIDRSQTCIPETTGIGAQQRTRRGERHA